MRASQGFVLVTPGNDFGHLTRGMKAAVALALGGGGDSPAGGAHGY